MRTSTTIIQNFRDEEILKAKYSDVDRMVKILKNLEIELIYLVINNLWNFIIYCMRIA